MDQSDDLQEQVREVQLLLSTQLAHAATLAAVKAIEGREEIDISNLKPGVSGGEFLDVVVFCSFSMGMLGRYRATPARNYILDSLFLFLGSIVLRFQGINAVRKFERSRISRMTRYMNQFNNLFGDLQNTKRGLLTSSLVADFETEVLKRPLPALGSVLMEFISAQELVSDREGKGLRSALQVDLGRNGNPATITRFLEKLTSNKGLLGANRFAHLEETASICELYLRVDQNQG